MITVDMLGAGALWKGNFMLASDTSLMNHMASRDPRGKTCRHLATSSNAASDAADRAASPQPHDGTRSISARAKVTLSGSLAILFQSTLRSRSEERRVGKEASTRGRACRVKDSR